MIVISGAGLAGLITAKILLNNKIYKPEEIILIDQERELGGLFKPYRSNKLGDVDKGMHIYYETLIDEIDSIVFKSINNYENGWIFLEGNLKDIAGAFYKGKLQINTPYPDLRNFEKNSFLNYQYEIINALKNIAESSNTKAIYKGLEESKNLKEYWIKRFGNKIYKEIFSPISYKLYGDHGENISPIAAYLTKLDRIAIFDKEIIFKLGNSSLIRQIIAYPDQLNMPKYRLNNQKGLYPKKGMIHIIKCLTNDLKKIGIKIYTDTKIQKIQKKNNQYVVRVCKSSKDFFSVLAKKIVWTGDQNKLIKLCCNYNLKDEDIELGESKFTYARLDKSKLNMSNLYYFYCYDSELETFRVTNLSSYSGKKDSEGRDLICIESHSIGNLKKKNIESKLDNNDSCHLNELLRMKVISEIPDSSLIDSFQVNKRIFPIPKIKNDLKVNFNRKNFDFKNIIYPGKNLLYSQKPFFLSDILKDIYSQIKKDI